MLPAAWGLGSEAYPTAGDDDPMTRAIRLVVEENLAASDAEDMPRLFKALSGGVAGTQITKTATAACVSAGES